MCDMEPGRILRRGSGQEDNGCLWQTTVFLPSLSSDCQVSVDSEACVESRIFVTQELLSGCGHCHSHKPRMGILYFAAAPLQQNKCACDLKVIFMRTEITPVLLTIMH